MHCKSSRNSEYFPDQPLMYERFRKEKIEEARSKCYETRWEWERDGHDGYCCDADILLWHFKMVQGTLGMLDAIVTFHDAANLEPTHDNLFSRSLALGTCTGCPRTHRTANHSIRKHLLRQPKNTYDNYIICVRNRNKKCYQKIFWCFTLVN